MVRENPDLFRDGQIVMFNLFAKLGTRGAQIG